MTVEYNIRLTAEEFRLLERILYMSVHRLLKFDSDYTFDMRRNTIEDIKRKFDCAVTDSIKQDKESES